MGHIRDIYGTSYLLPLLFYFGDTGVLLIQAASLLSQSQGHITV
jgi:hypothetical protein